MRQYSFHIEIFSDKNIKITMNHTSGLTVYEKLSMSLLLYQIPSRNLKNMTTNFTEKHPGSLCNPCDEL